MLAEGPRTPILRAISRAGKRPPHVSHTSLRRLPTLFEILALLGLRAQPRRPSKR